jgi:hypothetical protein
MKHLFFDYKLKLIIGAILDEIRIDVVGGKFIGK